MWPDGAQEEDQWEYDIAPRKGTVPHAVRGVHASLHELSYLRMILKNDGWTLITVLETTVQGKGTVDNQNFQTQLVPRKKEKVLSVITLQPEPLRLSWQRSPQPKRASEVQRGILTFG